MYEELKENPQNYIIPAGLLIAVMGAVGFGEGGGGDNLICPIYCGMMHPRNAVAYQACMDACIK